MPNKIYNIQITDPLTKITCHHCNKNIDQGDPIFIIYVNEKTQFVFESRNHMKKFFNKHEKAFVKEQMLKNFRLNYIYLEEKKED